MPLKLPGKGLANPSLHSDPGIRKVAYYHITKLKKAIKNSDYMYW